MSIASIWASGANAAQSGASTVNVGGIASGAAGPLSGGFAEASIQCPAAVAGTFANYYVGIASNAHTNACTCSPRINGSNSSISVTIPATTTGVFSDTSNSASIAQNDLLCGSLTTGADTNTIQDHGFGINFTPTSGNTATAIGASSVPTTSGTGPLTVYQPFVGGSAASTTLVNSQAAIPAAGTAKYLYTYCLTNGRSTTTSVNFNKNGTNGSGALSFTSGTTGLLKDTTNTDAVVAGDLVVAAIGLGTGTGNFQPSSIGFWNIATTDGQSVTGLNRSNGRNLTAGTTPFSLIGGSFNTGTTEANMQSSYPAATSSKIWLYVSANASSTNATAKFRKASANGNQVVTITASTTGAFQDTTNSDAYLASDVIGIGYANITTGTVTLQSLTSLLTVAGPAVAAFRSTLAMMGCG